MQALIEQVMQVYERYYPPFPPCEVERSAWGVGESRHAACDARRCGRPAIMADIESETFACGRCAAELEWI